MTITLLYIFWEYLLERMAGEGGEAGEDLGGLYIAPYNHLLPMHETQ